MKVLSPSTTEKPLPPSKVLTPEITFTWTEKRPPKGAKPRTGELVAKSKEHAQTLLKRQGIGQATIKKASGLAQGSVPTKQLAEFVRQLSVLQQSNVPIVESLSMIASNLNTRDKARLQFIVKQVRNDVESGIRLSEALRKYPKCFDSLFCNTLSAGEEAGQLDEVLQRLATHTEKILRTRQKIKKAMLYPCIVVIVAVAVTVGMLLFILPTFRDVYTQFGADLPALTTFLLDASSFLENFGLYLLAGTVVGGYLFFRSYKYSAKFKQSVDNILVKLPLFGTLLKSASYARWNRTLSTLSQSGVPLVDALDSVALLATLQAHQTATLTIRQDVSTGVKVSDSMDRTGQFPAEMAQMIRIGEDSGRVDHMLDRLALQYETQLDDLVDNLSTIMEPAIMVIIGGLVGTLIIGMYMPIFNMGAVL
ncbi:MAG: type II secretion system F family protein [Limnobacter sp.]|nr:type II secretion system F family protein [Limnobacter sp.]